MVQDLEPVTGSAGDPDSVVRPAGKQVRQEGGKGADGHDGLALDRHSEASRNTGALLLF